MKIFVCEPTPPAFFTAVFLAWKEKDCLITSDENIQLTFDAEVVRTETATELAQRVISAVSNIDKNAVTDIVNVLRSCDSRREQIAFGYVKRLMQCKRSIINAFNYDEVVAFNDLLFKINGEAHRIKGFLRFKESAGGALYAPYSPDNDITELIMPHFISRFKGLKFMIHDVKRKLAGVYNGETCIMGRADETEIYLSENEEAFERLWKRYYAAVNIESRPHEKQMKGSMPVRYWKFLPEKN